MFGADTQGCDGDTLLKQLWNHSDAILCCSLKTNVRFYSVYCFWSSVQMFDLVWIGLEPGQIYLGEVLISFFFLVYQASPVFTFANQAGLDMLETTLVALQDIMLDKTLDDSGRKALCSEFAKIMQQVFSFAFFFPRKVVSYFFPGKHF